MAWTNWPLVLNDDPFDVAVWQEIVDAINERSLASGGAGYVNGNCSAGGDWFSAANVVGVQAAIQSLVPLFVNHTDNGGNWDGVALGAIAPMWTWADICVAASVGDGTSWTRHHGANGETTSYGQAQAGDCSMNYGPAGAPFQVKWLAEMYRVLNLLRWTKRFGYEDSGIDMVGPDGISDENRYEWAQGATWLDLVAVWPNAFTLNDEGGFQIFPCNIYRVSADDAWMGFRGMNGRAKFRVQNLHPINHALDMYLYFQAQAGGGLWLWDDDGLGYAEDVYNLVISSGPQAGAEHLTDFVGNDATLQEQPPPAAPPGSSFRGWYAQMTTWEPGVGIVKWDVPGGFSKIT